jgi:hypothetical protein
MSSYPPRDGRYAYHRPNTDESDYLHCSDIYIAHTPTTNGTDYPPKEGSTYLANKPTADGPGLDYTLGDDIYIVHTSPVPDRSHYSHGESRYFVQTPITDGTASTTATFSELDHTESDDHDQIEVLSTHNEAEGSEVMMATSMSQIALRIAQDKTEVERKRMARIVGYVAVGLVLLCFALVGISLMMSKDIDDMGRYQFNMYS